MLKKLISLLLIPIFFTSIAYAKNSKKVHKLPVEDFVKLAIENDTVFEEILIDELSLKYSKGLQLPAKDIVLEIKGQYDAYFDLEKEYPEGSASLSKLFPYIGTSVSAEYTTMPSLSADQNSSMFTFLISQPLAENAFGFATRMHSKIIGIEIDVAKYQIVEAYEDYLATIITAYYNWYSAYENLKIGNSSYKQNLKLLENVKDRRRSNIALPIDVNKVNVQVLSKKENLITLEESYENVLNFIKQTIRYKGNEILEPMPPSDYKNKVVVFETEYENFKKESRTYDILKILEKKSSLEVKKNANELLPSTNLLLGYKTSGEDFDIKNEEKYAYGAISVSWPLSDQIAHAEYEISKITHKKTQISNENKYVQLYTDLKNLSIQIEREKKLISIADKKIKLAESILKDESQNYSYGKVTLNDYIDAVNRLDDNKFNRILHLVQLKILTTEWLRMTDQLINRKEIQNKPKL
ncbi:TolC family protein [Elusimicrobiota bacterium]